MRRIVQQPGWAVISISICYILYRMLANQDLPFSKMLLQYVLVNNLIGLFHLSHYFKLTKFVLIYFHDWKLLTSSFYCSLCMFLVYCKGGWIAESLAEQGVPCFQWWVHIKPMCSALGLKCFDFRRELVCWYFCTPRGTSLSWPKTKH
jgi:hypothetical protein